MKLDLSIRNYLLIGQKGMPMLMDALEYAKGALGTANLAVHPDFLMVGDEGTLSVVDAAAISAKCSAAPAMGKRIVILVNGIDSMSQQGQNKLLKCLEDTREASFLLIAYSGNVLHTVQSRCLCKHYRPLCMQEFCAAVGLDDAFAEYYACGGFPDMLEEQKGLTEIFRKIWICFDNGDLEGLLPAMNLVKEKDKGSITDTPYMHQALIFINACTMRLLSRDKENPGNQSRLLDMAKVINDGILESEDKRFNKNDFFLLIVKIISAYEAGEKEENK